MKAQVHSMQRPLMRKTMLAASVALVVAIAGCSSNKKSVSSSSHQGNGYASEQALQESVVYWEKRYKSSPSDAKAALNYGHSLRLSGRHEQSLAVLEKLAARNSTDKIILAAYGKALATVGRFQQALSVLEKHKHQPPRIGGWNRRWAPFMTKWGILTRPVLFMTRLSCNHLARPVS